MKLAYLTNINATDGTKTNADRLCRELDSRPGIDLTAVHIQGTGAPENFWTDELGYEALYPRSFRKGIEATDPDIVFVHGFNADMLDYLRDFAPEDDRVYTFRNGINTMENWLALYATPDPRTVTAPVTQLDLFDGVFAPSRSAAERIDFNYGPEAPHLAVAPCVIDYSEYVPQPFMQDDSLVVVTASRVAPNNYILAPILAVRRIATELDVDVELHVLGGADEPYRRVLSDLTGGMEEVNVLGHLPPDEARQYLQGADVVCVPSVTQQAVPTVAVEAMAAGSVVLSGDYRTASEESALVRVPVDHPPVWYDAIKDVVESPEEAKQIIRDGLDAAREYDVEGVVTEAYLPMFNLLLEEREMDLE